MCLTQLPSQARARAKRWRKVHFSPTLSSPPSPPLPSFATSHFFSSIITTSIRSHLLNQVYRHPLFFKTALVIIVLFAIHTHRRLSIQNGVLTGPIALHVGWFVYSPEGQRKSFSPFCCFSFSTFFFLPCACVDPPISPCLSFLPVSSSTPTPFHHGRVATGYYLAFPVNRKSGIRLEHSV
jgi:hypothetical protein